MFELLVCYCVLVTNLALMKNVRIFLCLTQSLISKFNHVMRLQSFYIKFWSWFLLYPGNECPNPVYNAESCLYRRRRENGSWFVASANSWLDSIKTVQFSISCSNISTVKLLPNIQKRKQASKQTSSQTDIMVIVPCSFVAL
jgi:hypothetical protein